MIINRIILIFIITVMLYSRALADPVTVSVTVNCNNPTIQDTIQSYILSEIKAFNDVKIIDKKEEPQIDLSIICMELKDQRIIASVMGVMHMWSEKVNIHTGKRDYVIYYANHYPMITYPGNLPNACSQIVAKFDTAYFEPVRKRGAKPR